MAAGAPRRADQPRFTRTGGELGAVDQIAVVAERDAGTRRGVPEHRLSVFPGGRAAGRVAAVSDGDVAFHRGQRRLVEDLADQPEILEDQHLGAVGDRDTRGLLPAMLQGVQAVVGELGDVFTRRPDAEYATLFAGFWIGLLAGHGMAAPRAGWVDPFSLRTSLVNLGIERRVATQITAPGTATIPTGRIRTVVPTANIYPVCRAVRGQVGMLSAIWSMMRSASSETLSVHATDSSTALDTARTTCWHA